MSATLPPEEQIVIALPDVIVHEITIDDEFLVVACDGLLPGAQFHPGRGWR
jgi:protein phosphatase 2C family protein 2/3